MKRRKSDSRKGLPRWWNELKTPLAQRIIRISLALFIGGITLYLGVANIEPLNATMLGILSALGIYMVQYPGEGIAFLRYFSHLAVSAYLVLYTMFATRFIHTLETAGYMTIFMSFLLLGMGKGTIPPRKAQQGLAAIHQSSLLKAWIFSSLFLLGAGAVIFLGLHAYLFLTLMISIQGATGIFLYFHPRLRNWPRRLFPNFVFTTALIVTWDFYSSHHQLEDKLGLMLAVLVLTLFGYGEARYGLRKVHPSSQELQG